ncbi:hypothetical protein [Parvicella tangerina]|uniref:Uncharacterized protein n=1 Tax=Parvicella tangerina TaxID=2829795 RepID=A0A916JML1_9FLAO|nr:hypothetical protein [Parvicella tangerina]CAG5082227.1 hypothetical protein CRYO30217_01846 [Parvicella tangerina]
MMTKTNNAIEAIKLNAHSIYTIEDCYLNAIMNLLSLAKYQFNSAFIIENINYLEEICSLPEDEAKKEKQILRQLAENSTIDAVKISLCFENIGKAILLGSGFIIHKVDKNINSDLFKEQQKRPIEISEFANDHWFEDDKVNTTDNNLKKKIMGVSQVHTIHYSTIIGKPKYSGLLNIDNDMLQFLREINDRRNQLHFLNTFGVTLKNSDYDRYKSLKEQVDSYYNKALLKYKDRTGKTINGLDLIMKE